MNPLFWLLIVIFGGLILIALYIFCSACRLGDIDEHIPEEPRLNKYRRGRS